MSVPNQEAQEGTFYRRHAAQQARKEVSYLKVTEISSCHLIYDAIDENMAAWTACMRPLTSRRANVAPSQQTSLANWYVSSSSDIQPRRNRGNRG